MVTKMVTKTDKGKKILRIGFEDVETWPEWCLRETQDCRQCHFEGKIACHPRFRTGLVRQPISASPREQVKALLKSGKRPIEVHKMTGISVGTIYSIGQQLRNKGELERIYEPHPESQKQEIVAYVQAHPDEQFIMVASKFGVDPPYVSRLASKGGIHKRKYMTGKRDKLVEKAIELLDSDPSRSITSVAEEIGMAATTLAGHMRRKGKMPINHEARVFLESVRQEVISAVLEAFSILRKERIIIVERTTEKR